MQFLLFSTGGAMRTALSCLVLLLAMFANASAQTREERIMAILSTHLDHSVQQVAARLDQTGNQRIELSYDTRLVRVTPVFAYLTGPDGDQHILLVVDPRWLESTSVTTEERQLAMVYAMYWIDVLDSVRTSDDRSMSDGLLRSLLVAKISPQLVDVLFGHDLQAMLKVCYFARNHDMLDATDMTRAYAQHGLHGIASMVISQITRTPAPLNEELEVQLVMTASRFIAKH
jgi:hypothetical protein